jgi:dipeptidyl aminopeptidase/acylaminoacyl peptidase
MCVTPAPDPVLRGPFWTDLIAAGLDSLTALALACDFDIFAAGVDYAFVHDGSSRFLTVPGASPEKARAAFDSSPVSRIKSWHSFALVTQGDDDRNVQLSQMMQGIGSLRKQGVEFEQIVIPDEVHGLILYRNTLNGFRATNDFLYRHLTASQEQR